MDNLNDRSLTKKQRRELQRQEKADQRKREINRRKAFRLFFWIIIFLAVGGGLYVLVQSGAQEKDNSVQLGSTGDSDWIKGNSQSNITLVEYSDFQCPACAYYSSIFDRLAEEFSDSVKFVFRHFPLRSIHQHAQLAAQAAEAAGRQNKFWAMHDLLFEKQSDWSSQQDAQDIFIGYAELLDLDIVQFKNDLTSEPIEEKVNKDYQNALSAGLNSTPTFILNGEKIDIPSGLEDFRILLKEAGGSSSATSQKDSTDESADQATAIDNAEETIE